MIHRARREGGQAEVDLEDLARINTNRLLHVVDRGLYAVIGMAAFWLTFLGVLGFYYDVEFAQAIFLLMAPMSVVVWRSVLVSRRIAGGDNQGEALYGQLIWHRRVTQSIGMLAVTLTALYGTWQNINSSYVILPCAAIAAVVLLYRQHRVRGARASRCSGYRPVSSREVRVLCWRLPSC